MKKKSNLGGVCSVIWSPGHMEDMIFLCRIGVSYGNEQLISLSSISYVANCSQGHWFPSELDTWLTEGRPHRRDMVLSNSYVTQKSRFRSCVSESDKFQLWRGCLCKPNPWATCAAKAQNVYSRRCGLDSPCAYTVCKIWTHKLVIH